MRTRKQRGDYKKDKSGTDHHENEETRDFQGVEGWVLPGVTWKVSGYWGEVL